MLHGLLFKKTSTCYKNPDIEYLDETSDYKLRIMVNLGKITEEEFQIKHKELEKSISYLTKENHGRVYAGGFIRDMLLEKKGVAPEKLDNQLRKNAITAAVYKTSRKYGAYRGALGHKMVFSVSEDLCQKVEKSGLKLDDLLGREVKKIMYEFQRKFHPGEKIGFAWGIHHDTKHRHVHVYLCNRTNQGNHVALSNPLKERRDRRKRKDQIGYMKERCVAAQERMIREADKRLKNIQPEKITDLKIEKEEFRNSLGSDKKLSQNVKEKQQKLDEVFTLLRSKENTYKLLKAQISEEYKRYYFRKDLISRGWDDVRALNESISDKYKSLKESSSGHFSSTKFLKSWGYLPRSGVLTFFSKVIGILHSEADRLKREEILAEISESQAFKEKLIEHLKVLDREKKLFILLTEQMKREREQLKDEMKNLHKSFEDDKILYNLALFKELNKDPSKEKVYHRTGSSLWKKRRAKEDFSKEKAILRKMDQELWQGVSQEQTIEKEKSVEPVDPVDSKTLKFNFNFFLKVISDPLKRLRYEKAGKLLWQKKKSHQDYSKELSILQEFDEEAKRKSIWTFESLEKQRHLDDKFETLKFKYDFFMVFVKDEEMRKNYREVSQKVVDKMGRKEDFSSELNVLKEMNSLAFGIALKLFPKVKNEPEDPGRGMKI